MPQFRTFVVEDHEEFRRFLRQSLQEKTQCQVIGEASDGLEVISDCGRGFDVEAALKGRGLGLTSMHERVRLVGGAIVIDSKPMHGTTIHVHVPLQSKQSSQRRAV